MHTNDNILAHGRHPQNQPVAVAPVQSINEMCPDAQFMNCFNTLAFPNFASIGGNFRGIWSFQSITPLAMIVGWFASRHGDDGGKEGDVSLMEDNTWFVFWD